MGTSTQGTKFARRLFDANGDEISDVGSLKTEQELFLSMGEPFKVPYGKSYLSKLALFMCLLIAWFQLLGEV